jgi:circadian clock protein KaiB
MTERLVLTLYISGRTPRAERALDNLRTLCDAEFGTAYVLQIVDVLEDPERAERDRILATPTVVKELPPPLRRVIGDLSDHEKVLVGLDIKRLPA